MTPAISFHGTKSPNNGLVGDFMIRPKSGWGKADLTEARGAALQGSNVNSEGVLMYMLL